MSAHLAEAQAAVGSITKSNIEGNVTAGSNAGKAEATLLASRAIDAAAEHVAATVAGKLAGKRVVLMHGAHAPSFATYQQFLVQSQLLKALVDQLENKQDKNVPAARAQPRGLSPGMSLTTLSAAIDAAAKLGSYFLTDYQIGSLEVKSDAEQLVSAVANWLLRVENISVILPRSAFHSSRTT